MPPRRRELVARYRDHVRDYHRSPDGSLTTVDLLEAMAVSYRYPCRSVARRSHAATSGMHDSHGR